MKETLMYEFLINDMIENNITPDRTTFDHLLDIVNDIDAAMKCWDLMYVNGINRSTEIM